MNHHGKTTSCQTCSVVFRMKRDTSNRYCSMTCSRAGKRRAIKRGALDRFFDQTDDSGGPDSCWLWKGVKSVGGYGRFYLASAIMKGSSAAHRASYLLFVDEIPEDMLVLHRCDVPACVNPRHLFLGTQKDNMADCKAKGRHVPLRADLSGSAKLSWEVVDAIRRLYTAEGLTARALSLRFRISESQVRNVLHNRCWRRDDYRPPVMRKGGRSMPGAENPNAKVTAETAAEMRRKWQARSCTQKELQKEYGLSETTVYRIVSGKSWTGAGPASQP